MTYKLSDLIDTLISHNQIVALHRNEKDEKGISYYKVFWRGMFHQLPNTFYGLEVDKIFGTIPEHIYEADIINILIK